MDSFCGNCGAQLDIDHSKDCPACGQLNATSVERFGQPDSNLGTWIFLGIVIIVLLFGFSWVWHLIFH